MRYGDSPKKTEYITFRTTKAVRAALESVAMPKKWSISLLVEDIVQQWLQENGYASEPDKDPTPPL